MSRADVEAAEPRDRSGGCPELDALETLVRPGAPPPPGTVAAHLETCSRCRDLLAEMRSANAFLARFNSTGGEGHAPDGRAPEGPGLRAIHVSGYEVERLIAFGGQGTVYKARQKATGRDVAIKVPIGDTQRRPSTRFRFQREIELTARLDHPGIVRVFGDCSLDDGRIGCVMEFVEGLPVDRWASEQRPAGRAGVRRIIEVLTAVADAIAYAHIHAVMHRDIKPSNVVVTPEGSPRVLDFGLAKALNESGRTYATLTGAFVGTLVYAAPEQISGGQDATDLRTDVYALGLLLFQALTGRLPFATDAPTVEILDHIRQVPPPRPSSLAKDVGPELDAIILKALAKEQERRYSSAASLRDDLRRWLAGEAVLARRDSAWYVVRKLARRHHWAVAMSGSSLVALTVIVALWFAAHTQATRATLAAAVRDARTLESHRVQMAEARSMARESFALGEGPAWDALLEPEPILESEGIEGFGPAGPLPASPAYWALWEIYARTPIVASLPEEIGTSVLFAGRPDRVIVGRGKRFTWWDWRHVTSVRRLDVSMNGEMHDLGYSSDPERLAVRTTTHEFFLIDAVSGEATPVAQGRNVAGGIFGLDRLALVTFSPKERQSVEVWDTAADPPRQIASHTLSTDETTFASMAFESSRRFLGAVDMAGHIIILEAETGRIIYDRSPEEEPLLNRLGARGPAEFIAWGPDQAATIQISADRAVSVGVATRKSSILDAVKTFFPGSRGDRYLFGTDRQRIGVGSLAGDATEGRLLPTITATSGSLSPDGRYAAMSLVGSARGAVFDLDSNVVRRLPFPAGHSAGGYATVFDLEFSPDGSGLYACAMDGSVRRFSAGRDEYDIVSTQATDAGAAAIALAGDDILVGGHDLSRRGTPLALLRPGSAPTILATVERRICGLVAGPGGAAWALTGGGQLLKLDTLSGAVAAETDLAAWLSLTPLFRSLARTPSGGPLLVASAVDGILLVDPETLEPLGPINPAGNVRALAASPTDPDLFASCGDEGTIQLWRTRHTEPPTLELVRAFGAHAGPAFCIAFHPDGRLLASGGGAPEAKDLRIWDTQTGNELAALDLFEMGVFDVAFSPDGRWLAAGGEVRLEYPDEGGQLFLIDLQGPDAAIAGNLEYQIARFTREHGHEPRQAGTLRRWGERRREAESPTP